MNFAGSELQISAFQINTATGNVYSNVTFPNARTTYEESQNVYPVAVKKLDPSELPTGLDPNQLYYLRKTGSNYKFYLTLENAVAETSHFVFTDAKDFLLVFTKFRRTIGTQSIAESVGDMYCCEPPLDLNSTTLYDRCTVVWEGDSYTLKRVSLLYNISQYSITYPWNSLFTFRSDPFLKNQMWHVITITAQYKEIQTSPIAWVSDYDFMTLELNVTTASTFNQLGRAHIDGATLEYFVGNYGSSSLDTVCVGGEVTSVIVPSYLSTINIFSFTGSRFGYWAAPDVVITSTTGTGATAVANLGGGGRVISITITNGGSGYTTAIATLSFNGERRFELINPTTSTIYWPTSSFPYSGTLTDADTVRNLPSITYAFSGTSVMPPATVVLKGAYFAGTKATMFPTALELPNCVAVATSTITLSGLQTIGGVLLQAGDRVLVMGNNSYPDSSKSNGIYVASAGSWSRSGDVFVDGSYTFVNQGAGGKLRYRIKASGFVIFPIVFGTSPLVFTVYTAANLPVTYDNVDLGNITTTCYHDAETRTYYSAVMTLNGIPGRINFGTLGGLPATNRAKFLIEQIGIGPGANINLSNDDFNGLSGFSNYEFETVSDPPGVVVPTTPPRFFTGITQSDPFFDTRLIMNSSFVSPFYKIYLRTEDTSRTGAIMTLQFSRVGRAVKNLGMIGEIFYIKAYYGDSYITTL